jgi:hypothetical protein
MEYKTISWVAGNPLKLQIPLQKVVINRDGRQTVDYEPTGEDTVTILLMSRVKTYEYTPEIEGNIATIEDNGQLLIGTYAVETLVVESDGTKRRSYYPCVINVLKDTPSMLSYFDDFPQYADGVLLDTPSIFFSIGSGGTIDAYTKEESDARFVQKVEMDNYYTKTQMQVILLQYASRDYVNDKAAVLQNAIDLIEAVIPSAASSSNQLADKNFVNSSISTNTATFVGTYNSLAELQAVTGATNNDYGFVIETDALGNEYYDRYKYNGSQWLFEYKVESTPFTAAQWAAIQSGITSNLVTKLTALPTAQELATALNGKADANDLVNKEDKVDIVSASGTTLTAEVGKYYTLSNVGTLAITLPTIAAGTTKVQTVTFYMSAGSTPAVTFTSTHSIYYSDGFEIAADTTYEVSAAYNGIAWVVASVKIVIPT